MQSTVISHFRNEEQLLPYWLQHHRELFDHGILINYGSSDSSCDIIRELVPEWELIDSRNETFLAGACDAEIMDIEKRLTGWKMALTTPEFVFLADLKERLELFERSGHKVFAFNIIQVTDSPIDKPLSSSPLVLQRTYGYRPPEGTRQWRCIHCEETGKYASGRHGSTGYQWCVDDTLLLWYGYAPYSMAKSRKLSIQDNVPLNDLLGGHGVQHILTPDEFGQIYCADWKKGSDLFLDPVFAAEYAKIAAKNKTHDYVPNQKIRERQFLKCLSEAARAEWEPYYDPQLEYDVECFQFSMSHSLLGHFDNYLKSRMWVAVQMTDFLRSSPISSLPHKTTPHMLMVWRKEGALIRPCISNIDRTIEHWRSKLTPHTDVIGW